jgi:hypothetical protein
VSVVARLYTQANAVAKILIHINTSSARDLQDHVRQRILLPQTTAESY